MIVSACASSYLPFLLIQSVTGVPITSNLYWLFLDPRVSRSFWKAHQPLLTIIQNPVQWVHHQLLRVLMIIMHSLYHIRTVLPLQRAHRQLLPQLKQSWLFGWLNVALRCLLLWVSSRGRDVSKLPIHVLITIGKTLDKDFPYASPPSKSNLILLYPMISKWKRLHKVCVLLIIGRIDYCNWLENFYVVS